MADTTATRSSERVRRAIEDTRHQMDETVDALTDRFSPDTMLDDAWARLKGDGGIRQMMRDHPIPVALVGVGLGWLAVEQATGVRESRRYYQGEEHAPELDAHGDPFAEEIEGGDGEPGLKERALGAASSMKEGASSVKDNVSSAMSSARERASGMMESAKRRRRVSAYRARTGARRAKQGFREMMEQSPLALGAVAFGVGMAGGLSVPTTRAENRTMGHASDALKEEAKRMGSETVEKAKHVAGDAAAAARDEAGHVADAAKDAARRSAREEGLTREGMEHEAHTAREHMMPHERNDAEALSKQRRGAP